ncbi:hypothetical protein [Trichothermofontia sp.]
MDTHLPMAASFLSRQQPLNFLTGASVAATTGSALYVAGKSLTLLGAATGAGGAILAKDARW